MFKWAFLKQLFVLHNLFFFFFQNPPHFLPLDSIDFSYMLNMVVSRVLDSVECLCILEDVIIWIWFFTIFWAWCFTLYFLCCLQALAPQRCLFLQQTKYSNLWTGQYLFPLQFFEEQLIHLGFARFLALSIFFWFAFLLHCPGLFNLFIG